MTRRGGGCGRIIQTAPIDQVALQCRGYRINVVKYREQHDNYVVLAGVFSWLKTSGNARVLGQKSFMRTYKSVESKLKFVQVELM